MMNLGTAGRSWTRQSLQAGKVLSHAVLSGIDIDAGETLALGIRGDQMPPPANDLRLSAGLNTPEKLSLEAASEDLLQVISGISEHEGPLALVIEDDLRRPGDPAVRRSGSDHTLILGETVCHWAYVADQQRADMLRRFISASSSGYPLNAFLVHRDAVSTMRANSAMQFNIIPWLRAIINAVFDYESYAIWIPTDSAIGTLDQLA